MRRELKLGTEMFQENEKLGFKMLRVARKERPKYGQKQKSGNFRIILPTF